MREVRMEIEGRNTFHKPEAIELGGDFERRGGTIRQLCWPKAEAVPDRQAQPVQQRNAEIAEALPCGNGRICCR
jgi:hypothetical protein